MTAMLTKETGPQAVEFMLNGRAVTARPDENILQAARRHGVDIPHLCYSEGLRPAGNCRACVVEIKGERVLAPSCCRHPQAGMEVASDSARARHSQKMVLELLKSDMPAQSYTLDSELDRWAKWLGVATPRFAPRLSPDADLSHPAIAVNLDACIQCTRCVRACREEQVNDVGVGMVKADKTVASLCPYCGVGCQLTYHVKDNRILHVEGRDGPANHGRLCVKGRYGFDYVHHKHRLTKPLIRKPGVPKSADFVVDPDNALAIFREASWEEALDFAAGKLREIRDSRGPQALAGFGSAKGSNEEAYLFQKLVRTGFRSNNVDHCTRLCGTAPG